MAANPRIAQVERATSRTWDDWLRFMEAIGASGLDHGQIAQQVSEELDGRIESPSWWAQAVTVAYEQDIGRRLPGQRPDGTFQTSVSRATASSMTDLMAAWVRFAATDETVQGVVAAVPRLSGTDKRLTWRAKAHDGSSVVVTSEPKKGGTASLVATQIGVPTLEANDEARVRWVEVLARFLGSATVMPR